MMAEAPVMDNEVFNHYLTGMTPAEFAEHLKDSCPEFGDLNVQELLLVQESAFQFIQNKNQNKDMASSYGETSDDNLVLEHENELPHGGSIEHQLALDEALARALELGDDFNYLSVNEDAAVTVSAVDNTRSTSRATPSRAGSQNIRQDDFDPDTMTYEVGYAACINSLLMSCNHWENLLEARAEDLQRILSHGYQHSDTNQANLVCSRRKRRKQKSMVSLTLCIRVSFDYAV
ncbi:hypothetical protein SASPL_116135 [Salvia splendens]|uniref:Uncharacterized protein n=1 Tax=Salvia splendens TaxID=180675 RepID=A0A8X8Y6B3_SALSN|nr:hypothetical protein SASPL_116135 [Salvia splendens]